MVMVALAVDEADAADAEEVDDEVRERVWMWEEGDMGRGGVMAHW